MGCAKSKSPKQTISLVPAQVPSTNPPSQPPVQLPSEGVKKSTISAQNRGNYRESYDIIRQLAKGGLSTVFLVKDKRTGTLRAMKEIQKAKISSEESKKMISEIELLRKLVTVTQDHPNIMAVFEVIESVRCFYVITEYLSGGELFEEIVKREYFTERHAANYLKQIMGALSYIHSQNIVHRDVKPENLVLISEDPDSPLKLIDFGISEAISPEKQLTEAIGTLIYTAPEVFEHSYNEKCDIWSAGVILYIMLSGSPPFKAATKQKTEKKIEKAKLSFKEAAWESVSKKAKKLVKEMLEKDPKKRLSAAEVLHSKWVLDEALQVQEVNSDALSVLQNFHVKSKIDKAIRLHISSLVMNNKEADELVVLFNSLDTDSDGKLSREELIDGYTRLGLASPLDIDRIMNEVDIGNTGFISFSEFAAATRSWGKGEEDSEIRKAFDLYDFSNDGYIDVKDLREIISGVEEREWETFLNRVDKDRDGRLNYGEFRDYILANTE